ncbi:MAG: hypothetical protein V2I48_12775 [Xanthomonadales bacterium]|jgi:hypothetical protein|nr:hypothetical protein [Xanthomonadales bacterium]
MRRESAVIFIISLIITTGVVGGLYYLNVGRPVKQEKQPIPEPVVQTAAPVGASAASRSDKIIKCVDAEIGEFYTNATSCEKADLENRMSHAQPTYESRGPTNPTIARQADSSTRGQSREKPDIRRVAKSVPSGLSVSCKFSAGRALEIERNLSIVADPADSIWKENYCKWIREARKEKCELESGFFYYESICY